MTTVFAASKRVGDPGLRISGRLDNHVDPVRGDERVGVVGQERCAAAKGFFYRFRSCFLTFPADRLGGAAGSIDIEVCNPCDVQAWRARGLRQEHRTELARSDQTNADRLSRSRPFGQFRRHAHETTPQTSEV